MVDVPSAPVSPDAPVLSDTLARAGITYAEWLTRGLDWATLQVIGAHHTSQVEALAAGGEMLQRMLQRAPSVHSTRMRVKSPEGLIAKMIRKSIIADLGDYQSKITDLIGLRALHLYKDDWRQIHDFVHDTYVVTEPPIAYIRDGDPQTLQGAFAAAGCTVKEHPRRYRSVHYLIQQQVSKQSIIAELQVRTVFEEGWSEIDHQIGYPTPVGDDDVEAMLQMFNRIAGAADEMATAVHALGRNRRATVAQIADLNEQRDAASAATLKQTSMIGKFKSERATATKRMTELTHQLEEATEMSLKQTKLIAALRSEIAGAEKRIAALKAADAARQGGFDSTLNPPPIPSLSVLAPSLTQYSADDPVRFGVSKAPSLSLPYSISAGLSGVPTTADIGKLPVPMSSVASIIAASSSPRTCTRCNVQLSSWHIGDLCTACVGSA